MPRLRTRCHIRFRISAIFSPNILCCKLDRSTNQTDILLPSLVMEYLDFASDFNFLHEEEVLVPDTSSLLSKDNGSFVLVADEAYSLGPGQGVVQQYSAWTGGKKLIGEVRERKKHIICIKILI